MSVQLVNRFSEMLARTDRRGFLARTAIVSTAVVAAPSFLFRPISAYAAVCNCRGNPCACGSACCDGYTVFCCTITGQNTCPPGSALGGWWKADGQSFCGGGPRFYMDCNTLPGAEGICGCGCAGGDCNNRAACCVHFRYGQCHQEIPVMGAIVCRVVTCTAPWVFDPTCTTSPATDENTASHDAPCLAEPPPSWHATEVVRADGTLSSSPQPVAVRGVRDRLDVFTLGTDGGIWWTSLRGGAWQPWTSLQGPPGGCQGQPAVVSWVAGRYDVFVRGADNRLWQRFWDGAAWSAWIQPVGSAGPVLADAPAASSRGPGRLDVFITGTDGNVYQRFCEPSGWSGSWIPRGAPPGVTASGRPTVASWDSQRVDVFVRGSDNKLWQTFWDGGAWSSWLMPPGTGSGILTASPAAVSPARGYLSVFGRGTDGGLYTTSFSGGPGWAQWQRLGTPNDRFVGAPGATTQGLHSLEVMVRGTDNRAYRYRYGP